MCNNTVIISRYLHNPRSQEISHCTCNVSNYSPLKVWILGKEFLVGEIPDKPCVVSMIMSAKRSYDNLVRAATLAHGGLLVTKFGPHCIYMAWVPGYQNA